MELHPYFNIACTLMVSAIFIGVDAKSCTKMNSCSCTYGYNQVVDLSPLQGNPKWVDTWDSTEERTYSYNPCKPFSERQCNNVAMCQFNGTEYNNIGTQDTATFQNDPVTGILTLSYHGTDDSGITRFFVLVAVYFIAGILFNKVARNAEGAEMVPNATFWGALPGLIRDGMLFVVRCGRGSYNEI